MFEEHAAGPSSRIDFYRASGPYGFLSNLFPRPIMFEGRGFPCAEFAYQYGKPLRQEVKDWLMAAPKPHLCAAAAHALLRFDVVPDWSSVKVPRMRDVLLVKFCTRLDLALKLLETGDALLVEASSTDAFWGIGRNGAGQNMLGQLLMQLRVSLVDAVPPEARRVQPLAWVASRATEALWRDYAQRVGAPSHADLMLGAQVANLLVGNQLANASALSPSGVVPTSEAGVDAEQARQPLAPSR